MRIAQTHRGSMMIARSCCILYERKLGIRISCFLPET